MPAPGVLFPDEIEGGSIWMTLGLNSWTSTSSGVWENIGCTPARSSNAVSFAGRQRKNRRPDCYVNRIESAVLQRAADSGQSW